MLIFWIIGTLFTDGLIGTENTPWHIFFSWPYQLGKYINEKLK